MTPWKTIRGELKAYGHGLADKPEIVVLNKADAVPAAEMEKKRKALKRAAKREPLVISAVSGAGVPEAMATVLKFVRAARAKAEKADAIEAAEAE